MDKPLFIHVDISVTTIRVDFNSGSSVRPLRFHISCKNVPPPPCGCFRKKRVHRIHANLILLHTGICRVKGNPVFPAPN